MPLNSKSAASCVIYPVREDQHAYNHSNSHSQRHPSHQADLLPLKEYQHISKRSQDGHRTVEEVVTIESVANQKFFISVELDPNSYSSLMSAENEEDGRAEFENDYLIFVYMDGVKVQRSKRHRSHVGPTRVSGAYTSDLSASRSFQFGKLSLVDVEDESLDNETLHRLMSELCNDERVMQSLGTIRIDIHRCRLGKSTKTKPRDSSDRGRGRNRGSSKGHQRADQRGSGEAKEIRTSNQMKFSEQSKKVMLSHTAGLGDALPVEGVTRSKFKRDVEQKDEHPFLRFIFNYKSRSLLEAEGIIQPSQPQTRVTEARSEPRQRQRPGSQQDDPQSWSGKRKDPPKKEDSDDDDFLLFDLSPRKQDKSGQQASSLNRSDEHHSKKNEQEKESYKEPRDEKPEPSCVTIYSSSSDEEETKDRTDPTNKKAKTDSKGDQKPRVSLGSSSCSNSLNDSKKPDSKDCLRDRNTVPQLSDDDDDDDEDVKIVVTAVKKEEGQGQRSEESSTANKGSFKDEEEVDRKGFKKYEEEVKEGLDEVKGSEAPKRKKRSIGRMIIDLTMTSSDSE